MVIVLTMTCVGGNGSSAGSRRSPSMPRMVNEPGALHAIPYDRDQNFGAATCARDLAFTMMAQSKTRKTRSTSAKKSTWSVVKQIENCSHRVLGKVWSLGLLSL